jgi:hypothetical protein
LIFETQKGQRYAFPPCKACCLWPVSQTFSPDSRLLQLKSSILHCMSCNKLLKLLRRYCSANAAGIFRCLGPIPMGFAFAGMGLLSVLHFPWQSHYNPSPSLQSLTSTEGLSPGSQRFCTQMHILSSVLQFWVLLTVPRCSMLSETLRRFKGFKEFNTVQSYIVTFFIPVFSLLIDPEHGSEIFLQNVPCSSIVYTLLYRRQFFKETFTCHSRINHRCVHWKVSVQNTHSWSLLAQKLSTRGNRLYVDVWRVTLRYFGIRAEQLWSVLTVYTLFDTNKITNKQTNSVELSTTREATSCAATR